MESTHARRSHYRPHLDGLRGISVLAVVFFHARAVGVLGGFLGVDVFFVLSGYLIGAGLLAELGERGQLDLRAFYVKRFARLVPAQLLTVGLASAAVVSGVLSDDLTPWDTSAGWMLTFSSQLWLARDFYGGQLLHSWSLGIEETFYVLLPAGLILLARGSGGAEALSRRLLVLSVGWTALAALAAGLEAYRIDFDVSIFDSSPYYFGFRYRCFELLIGVWLAALLRHATPRLPGGSPVLWAALAACAAALVLAPRKHPVTFAAILPAFSWLVALVLLALESSAAGQHAAGLSRVLSSAPLVRLGRVSYGVYLFHFPLLRPLRNGPFEALTSGKTSLGTYGTLLFGLIVLALSWLLAELSFRACEAPLSRAIRARFVEREPESRGARAVSWLLAAYAPLALTAGLIWFLLVT